MVVSEGSFKDLWGTAALIIEVQQYTNNRIRVTCTTPGLPKEQESYSSEISGLLQSVIIVEII